VQLGRILHALKQWKLACPKSKLDLVFPNEKGRIESHGNAITRAWQALQLVAGVGVPELDEKRKPVISKNGAPVARAKYSGLHALRHFFCQLVRGTPPGRRPRPAAQDNAGAKGPLDTGHDG